MEDKNELIGINCSSVEIDNLCLRMYKQNNNGGPRSFSDVLKYVALHIHTYYEIIACTEERATLLTRDGEISLKKGDIAIVPPDFQHTMIRGEGKVREWMDLAISCNKTANKSGRNLWKKYRHMFKISGPIVFSVSPSMIEELRGILTATASEDSLATLLRLALFLDELSDMEYELLSLPDGSKGLDGSSEEGLDEVRFAILNDIVSRRYTENIDPEEVASCLYISRRHLDRIIKSRFGSSLRDLINAKRLELAAKLLKESNATVDEVAVSSGFSSKEVFCRAFRNKYGASPTDYRKGTV